MKVSLDDTFTGGLYAAHPKGSALSATVSGVTDLVQPSPSPTDPAVDLAQKAQTLGISTQFEDWHHQLQHVDAATVRTLVEILEPDQPGQQTTLPACVVMRQDQPALLPQGEGSWQVLTAAGERLELAPGSTHLPADLPLGDHQLVGQGNGQRHEIPLAVCPTREQSQALLPAPGQWGIWVQVYAMRSAASWGHGDLADVRTLAQHAAQQWGADYLLLNPLHALGVGPFVADSPYLPSSRRFFSPLYLPIEALPDYHQAPPEIREKIAELAAPCKHRNTTTELIERSTVWQAKRAALELLYAQPSTPQREQAFADYVQQQGQDLRDFALWCALSDQYISAWPQWPQPLRQRDPHAVEQAHQEHAAAVRWWSWVQWLVDEQLQLTQQAARQAGMRIGIIHDLAVGAGFDSADAWAWQDVLATGASVGAPPDEFNQLGQDWGQPPWRPQALAKVAYHPFRALLRAVLRAGAGVRIDHILGLFRLWWVPQGSTPAAGTYVHSASDTLLALLALEAHQAGSFVVGEDLGNVGAGVRDTLADHALLGTSLLWFERDEHGQPKPAQKWRALSMATIGTHDLPPAAGFVAGEHIRVRQRLGLLTEPARRVWAGHRRELVAWQQALEAAGVLEGPLPPLPEDLAHTAIDPQQVQELVLGLHRFLAHTPARLVGVGLPDLAGDRNMINQPGTFQEYPNWRVPLADATGAAILLEDLLALPWAAQVAAAVREQLAGRDRPAGS